MSKSLNDEQVKLIGTQSTYVSSIFVVKGGVRDGTPHTLCTACPASLWYEQKSYQCFCMTMKTFTWHGVGVPITRCDGRERALAAMELEMEKLGLSAP